MKRALLVATRHHSSITSARPQPPPLLPSSLFTIGSSKDLLLLPSRSISTTPIPSASDFSSRTRTRLSKEQRQKLEKKFDRKHAQKAVRTVKAAERTDRERVASERKQEELVNKKLTAEALTRDLPPLREDELEGMYRGLITAKPEEISPAALALTGSSNLLLEDPSKDAQARETRLEALEEKLSSESDDGLGGEEESVTSVLSDRLKGRAGALAVETSVKLAEPQLDVLGQSTRGGRILQRIIDSQSSQPISVESLESEAEVPVGLVTRSEWRDILLDCAMYGHPQDVLTGLDIMKKNLTIPDASLVTELMAVYASENRSQDALQLASFAMEHSLPLSVSTHHHLLSSIVTSQPDLALQHLYSLEAAGRTPLVETYGILIHRLVSPLSPPHLISRGWDLYAHMRLKSHPVPSPSIYATMIQACARGSQPSPERAIDLFTEMTDDNRLPLTREIFDGVIRACARHGGQENYFESLRYMRRMLDENIEPSRKTFHAVLEGCYRHGDLPRARWILVNMIKIGRENSVPNEHTMGLVFAAYARYRPTEKNRRLPAQGKTKKVEEDVASALDPSSTAGIFTTSGTSDPTQPLDVIDSLEDSSLFYPGPLPQNSLQVVVEATNLFVQCVGRKGLTSNIDTIATSKSSAFSSLVPSPFLLNHYLSVICAHAPFPFAVEFFREVYDRLDVPKNRYTYEIMMERCLTVKNKEQGVEVAKETFAQWKRWDEIRGAVNATEEVDDGEDGITGLGEQMRGKNISNMWTRLISVLARNHHIDESLALVNEFVQQYPPLNLLAYARSLRDIRKHLPTQPSSIRLSSPLYPETTRSSSIDWPPFLMFPTLRLLHHRLAEVEDSKNVALLKGVCLAYAGTLKKAKQIEEGVAQVGRFAAHAEGGRLEGAAQVELRA